MKTALQKKFLTFLRSSFGFVNLALVGIHFLFVFIIKTYNKRGTMNTNPALETQSTAICLETCVLSSSEEKVNSYTCFTRKILTPFKAIRNSGKSFLRVDRDEKRKRGGGGGWTRSAKHSVMKVGRFAGRFCEKQRK